MRVNTTFVGLLAQRHPDTKALVCIKRISYREWVGKLYTLNQLLELKQE
jgi:hypothetical protein